MRITVLIGRVLFSAIFILASLQNFSQHAIDFASEKGVPWAQFLVPLSGVLALVGGLSVLLGYRAKIGAALLVLFLVPVTLMMHNFWAVADGTDAQMQEIMFLKNLSMLGGALFIVCFGPGAMSLDSYISRRAGPAEKVEMAA